MTVKYKLELKPVKTIGVDKLPEDKLLVFRGATNFLASLIRMIPDVVEADVKDDLSIIFLAEKELDSDLKELHKEAILTKIS